MSSNNSGGHCSSNLFRRDSDVQLLNVHLQELGHKLQKFSDAKTLSVSDKLVNFFRFPTSTLRSHTYPERKHMLCTQGLQSKGKQQARQEAVSMIADMAGSEIRLSLAQRRKVATGSGLS